MKKTLYFLLIASALVACEPSNSGNTDSSSDSSAVVDVPPSDSISSDEIVLNDIVESVDSVVEGEVLTDANGNSANENNGKPGRYANPDIDLNAKTYTVTGHITIVSPYCGGAAPSKEILENAKKPQAYAKQPILIRKGKTNAVGTPMATRATTDANGDFNVQLQAGEYCLVLAEKENARSEAFNNTTTMVIDAKCDSKWLSKCDISFTVSDKNVSGLRLNLNKKCMLTTLSPCISYDGPLPPAAAPRGK